MIKLRCGQSAAVAAFLALGSFCCPAASDTNVLALGAWSEPVANEYGYRLRGRLAVCEYPDHRGPTNHVDLAVYVDLQEYSDSIGGGLHVYCDLSQGLKCILIDASGKPPPPVGVGWSGGAPASEWISLPPFASIRLRATVFSGGRLRNGDIGLWFPVGAAWTIKSADTNAYMLSATLTLKPAPNTNAWNHTEIWEGTLRLPEVQVPR
jgi:hypothetical protein